MHNRQSYGIMYGMIHPSPDWLEVAAGDERMQRRRWPRTGPRPHAGAGTNNTNLHLTALTEEQEMKKLLIISAVALLLVVPLVAANVNGFENFVLSRNDYKSNPSQSIAGFSSRTHSEASWSLASFSSREPSGLVITIK